MSDQSEKPKGTLPKGDDPNAQGEPQDQDKKIWDKYYNGEIELPNVVKELKHDGSNEDTKLETSDEDRDAVLKAWRRTQNIYGYSKQKARPKKKSSKPLEPKLEPKIDKKKELKDYEKEYLTRYKNQKKVKPKKKPSKLLEQEPETDGNE